MEDQQNKQYTYIDTAESLESLVKRMALAGKIAVDTEADSLHHYFEKVCLIQLAFNGENYIVDPLANLDLSKFLEALAAKPLIFHGADYDLRMLRTSFGFRPACDVFDTMIAAQLLGYKTIGLAGLVEKFFNVTMSKQGQKYNWAKRPLPENLLKYAGDDTKYLEQIFDLLVENLRKLDRYEWFVESCQELVNATATDRFRDPDEAWRIKGISHLAPQQLEFVRQIWFWRQEQAKKVDMPPFKIMVNIKIIELALWAASDPNRDFNDIPKLPKHCKNSRLQALKDAIKKAADTPMTDWPKHRKRRGTHKFDPRSSHIYEELRSECLQLADKLGIECSIIAPRASLVAVAKSRSRTIEQIIANGSMMSWQAKLFIPAIKKIMAKFNS